MRIALACIVVAPLLFGAASSRPKIEGLQAVRNAQGVLVDFQVDGAFQPELLDRIQSGIPVTFKHRIRVLARRGFPWTSSRELGRTQIETEVVFDALTGQYSLTRTEHYRRKDASPPSETVPDPRTLETESEKEMRRFMTTFVDIPVLDSDPAAAEPLSGRSVRVRVESHLERRFALLLFPRTRGAEAEVRLAP